MVDTARRVLTVILLFCLLCAAQIAAQWLLRTH